MSQFDNVSISKAATIYFDGKVTSRALTFPDGSRKTLGIMSPGEYRFDTQVEELMEIQAGELQVRLPGNDTWQAVKGGDSFTVEAGASFDLRVETVTDYCCSYRD